MEQGEETAAEKQDPPANVSKLESQFDFEQQQSQIAQLRDSLQKTQQTLSSTEKDKENYVATLSRIRMQRRSKGSQRKLGESSSTESPSKVNTSINEQTKPLPQTPEVLRLTDRPVTPGSAGRVKVNLLTQGVEEKRQLMEKVKRMNQETKQSIHGIAEQLKMNLPEKDVSKDSSESQHITDKAGSIDSSYDKTNREMYAQILYKDNKIIELNNRIMELERNIMDYQENLREKDSVLDAKARSITLITEDMSRRNKVTVDALEETRQHMREMQNQFVEMETKLKDENKTLSTNLKTKEERLNQLESLRFELSTRNADLQQKVVMLQTRSHEVLSQGLPADKDKIDELTRQLAELTSKGLDEDKTKISELTQQLEDSTKLVSKTKNQYGKKIKSLEKQLAALKKSGDVEQELQTLHNRIAELEDEKGNLQLSLVDFDEMKACEKQMEARVAELQDLVQQHNSQLESSTQSVTQLEANKLQLTQSVQQLQASESELQAELEAARAALQEQDNAKVEAEMKSVELEERLDQLNAAKSELETELESLRQVVQTEEKIMSVSIAESQATIELSHSEISTLSQQLRTEQVTKAELELSLQSTKEKLLEKEHELESLRQIISTHEHSNSSLQQEVTNLQQELQNSHAIHSQITTQLANIEEELRTKVEAFSSELKAYKEREDNLRTECEGLHEQMKVKEEELASLKVTVEMQGALGEEVEKWRSKLQKQRDEVQSLTQQLQASQSELVKLQEEKLKAKELENKLCDLNISLKATQATCNEQAEAIQCSQQAASAKESEHEAEVEALEMELEKKQQRACDLEEHLSKALESQQELTSQFEIATQELEEIKRLRNESDIMIERLSLQISQMEAHHVTLKKEKQELKEELEQLRKEREETNHAFNMALNNIKELQQEINVKNASLQNVGESEQTLVVIQTELTQLQRKYHDETTSLKQRAEQAEDEVSAAYTQVEHMTKEHRLAFDKWQQEEQEHLTQIYELNTQLENMEDTLSALRDASTELQVQLGVVIGEKEALDSERISLKENMGEFKIMNDKYAHQISELELELSNEQQLSIATVQVLKDDNNYLKTQLQQSHNFVSQLQAQLSCEQQNISTHVYSLEEEKTKLLNTIAELQQMCTALQLQCSQAEQDKESQVLSVLNEKQAVIDELETLKREAFELKAAIEKDQPAILQASERINTLNTEKSYLQKHIEEIVAMQQVESTRITTLEGKLLNATEENENLKLKLKQQQAEIESSSSELHSTLSETEKSSKENINHLNAELEGCKNHIQKLEASLADQTKQLEDNETLLSKRNDYCNKLSNELLASQNYCQMLQNIVSDLQTKIQGLQKVEVEQAENYMALTTKVKTTEEMNACLQEEILGLHRIMEEHPVWQESGDEARELKLQLQESEEERVRLNNEIDALVLKVHNGRLRLESSEQHEATKTEVELLQAEIEKLKQELLVAKEEVVHREVVNWEEQESWGDAGLEEQHLQQQQQQTTQSPSDQLLVAALQAQLAEAEAAQIRLQEELKGSQVRCGKLIKQVKNLKEQASKSQTSASSDLDKVLEQELQSQLITLQKELSEIQTEKSALLSKTETLLTANERLIDMKEQQDGELERSRKERAALMQQLNALQQWQPDEEGHTQRIAELEIQLRQARDKCVELEEAYEVKLLQDQVDNKVPTQEIGVATETEVTTLKSEQGTSPDPVVTEAVAHNNDESQQLRAELETKVRELRAREEEHHSLAAYIAQLRGALEAKSQEMVLYSERPSETELKAELDSALYLLHQRDVRCDELTLELMALMEERDALQLRLSSSLRMNEQQKSAVPISEPIVEDDTQNQQKEELHSKLSELRALGHMRDVALRGERETRHSEQQHMLLQPRSGSPILDSEHTLMRDSQSTSSVLFNWLWGRSTPRVQDM